MTDGTDTTMVSFEVAVADLDTFEARVAESEQFDSRSAALRYLVRRYNAYEVW